MLPFKKIMCPTDFSSHSNEALKKADELAREFDAELTVVHVIQNIPLTPIPSPPLARGFDYKLYETEYENNLKRKLDEVISDKVSRKEKVRPLLLRGNPASTIVDTAEKNDTDLIVLATHGQSGWKRFVFGSVAEKIVRLSEKPVLTVQPNEKGGD